MKRLSPPLNCNKQSNLEILEFEFKQTIINKIMKLLIYLFTFFFYFQYFANSQPLELEYKISQFALVFFPIIEDITSSHPLYGLL